MTWDELDQLDRANGFDIFSASERAQGPDACNGYFEADQSLNGINGRLPVLLQWLEMSKPDVVCLQELKAPDERFPISAIERAGYGAIWYGQKSWNGVAILARDGTPTETRRGLPADDEDVHSRYIEAAVEGILFGCLYLSNGVTSRMGGRGPEYRWTL